jgi:hypothetical protein
MSTATTVGVRPYESASAASAGSEGHVDRDRVRAGEVDLVERAREDVARPRPAADRVERPVIDGDKAHALVERLGMPAPELEAQVLRPPFRAVEPAEGGDREHRGRGRESDQEDDALWDADVHEARV